MIFIQFAMTLIVLLFVAEVWELVLKMPMKTILLVGTVFCPPLVYRGFSQTMFFSLVYLFAWLFKARPQVCHVLSQTPYYNRIPL